MRNSKHLLFPLLVAGAFVLAACGGGSDSSSEVSCVPLESFRAYRFEAVGIAEVTESEDPALAASSEFPIPFRLVVESKGEVQGEDRINATVGQGERLGFLQEGQTVAIGDKMWSLLSGVWVENVRSPLAVPYTPLVTCNAIAPDLILSDLSFTPEDVNGIASLHYQIEVPNEFHARHANFSSGGDQVRLIDTITADVWIAENGNYPIKVIVEGTGDYPDGSLLTSEVSYEIRDINATDIDITPPVQ